MAEALELQNTLVALLANMQKMSEDNKATKEEAIKQNRSLQSLHDENKKIYTAVHDQAKQNKQLLESTEKRIGEKVELIRTNIELALEANNSRLSDCEAKINVIEERMVNHTSMVNELVAEQEQRTQELKQQLTRLQSTSTPANQTTYIYKNYELNSQVKFYGRETESPLHFLKTCERDMDACLLYTSRCV